MGWDKANNPQEVLDDPFDEILAARNERVDTASLPVFGGYLLGEPEAPVDVTDRELAWLDKKLVPGWGEAYQPGLKAITFCLDWGGRTAPYWHAPDLRRLVNEDVYPAGPGEVNIFSLLWPGHADWPTSAFVEACGDHMFNLRDFINAHKSLQTCCQVFAPLAVPPAPDPNDQYGVIEDIIGHWQWDEEEGWLWVTDDWPTSRANAFAHLATGDGESGPPSYAGDPPLLGRSATFITGETSESPPPHEPPYPPYPPHPEINAAHSDRCRATFDLSELEGRSLGAAWIVFRKLALAGGDVQEHFTFEVKLNGTTVATKNSADAADIESFRFNSGAIGDAWIVPVANPALINLAGENQVDLVYVKPDTGEDFHADPADWDEDEYFYSNAWCEGPATFMHCSLVLEFDDWQYKS